MPMSVVPDPVPPVSRPGLPRTIGILNLVFGGLLLLLGAGVMGVLGPFLVENHPFQLDPVETQQVFDQLRLQMVNDLIRQESAAKTDVEKNRLKQIRAEFATVRATLTDKVNFTQVNADLPWLSRYLWVDTVTGPILNLLLILSGIGLIRRKGWGRNLAIQVAVMKLVRLAGLSAMLAVVVVPHMNRTMSQFASTELAEAFLKHAMDQDSPLPTPSISLKPAEFVQAVSALGYSYALISLAFGSIYPLIVLIVLHRSRVRIE